MNSLIIGRWAPFHEGHKRLIDSVLAEGKPVVVAIRDTKLSERNPYTVEERTQMIREVYAERVHVITIPDIAEVCYGRGVGWGVREIHLDEETEAISATSIRRGQEQTKRVQGFCLWFTGLPSSGKSTIADAVAQQLVKHREKVERLDGDTTRKAFWPELGFSKDDRDQNIKRVARLAKLLTGNGIAVIASFISPYRQARGLARREIGNFVEVYVKCPLEVCEQRDSKGLYRRARAGEIEEFTGVSAPYEEPLAPDLVVESDRESVASAAQRTIALLREEEYI